MAEPAAGEQPRHPGAPWESPPHGHFSALSFCGVHFYITILVYHRSQNLSSKICNFAVQIEKTADSALSAKKVGTSIARPDLARQKELESPAFRLGGGRSIQLSYWRI